MLLMTSSHSDGKGSSKGYQLYRDIVAKSCERSAFQFHVGVVS